MEVPAKRKPTGRTCRKAYAGRIFCRRKRSLTNGCMNGHPELEQHKCCGKPVVNNTKKDSNRRINSKVWFRETGTLKKSNKS